MIGKGEAFVSACLHAPIAGKVKRNAMVTLPNGRRVDAITIAGRGRADAP